MLHHDIANDNRKEINIVGVPGAGKTTLVINLSKHLKDKKFMYLSFGKENAKTAKTKMPNNVTCSSFHSLAKNELNISSSRIEAKITLSIMNKTMKSLGVFFKDLKMIESLIILNDIFCMSNIRLERIHDLLKRKEKIFPQLSREERVTLIKSYKNYWDSTWDSSSNIPINHNMYLKKFALNARLTGYDYLVVDETQDLNDAMFSIIENVSRNNQNIKTIKLGDPCQQIFTFIGSSSQFSRISFDYQLNTSHRFGKALCELANDFMEAQHLPYYTPIESNKDNTQILLSPSFEKLTKKINGGLRPTVIARYNMTLWYLLKNLALANIKCSINGSGNDELVFLKELYSLFLGNKSRHAKLKSTTYFRYSSNAKITHDNSAMLACKFVESIGSAGMEVFEKINNSLTSPDKASVLLSTVHQAKGLEFNHVLLMDDFGKCWSNESKRFIPIPVEDAHSVYTAITRAKKTLFVPQSWNKKGTL